MTEQLQSAQHYPATQETVEVLSAEVSNLLEHSRGSRITMRPVHDNSPYPLADTTGSLTDASDRLMAAISPDLQPALYRGEYPQDPNAATLLENAAAQRFSVTPIAPEQQSESLRRAGELFGAEEAVSTGVAVRLAGAGETPLGKVTLFEAFPAMAAHNQTFRLLATELAGRDPAWMQQTADLLCPPTVLKTDGHDVYAAQQMLEGAQTPAQITLEQLDDWMARLQMSDAEIGLDVDAEDQSLDNFLVAPDGRLYWCDGNIMDMRPLENSEKQQEVLKRWRETLGQFVNPTGESGY